MIQDIFVSFSLFFSACIDFCYWPFSNISLSCHSTSQLMTISSSQTPFPYTQNFAYIFYDIYNYLIIELHMQAEEGAGFSQRKKEAEMIRKFHPDKIPILLARNRNSKLKQFDNNKILILKSFTVFKLIMVIKKKLQINYAEAIYVFAGNTLLQADQTIESVYQKYAGQDRFLHLTYAQYATFGDNENNENTGRLVNELSLKTVKQ